MTEYQLPAPVATLHDDGYWTTSQTPEGKAVHYELSYAGHRRTVYTADQLREEVAKAEQRGREAGYLIGFMASGEGYNGEYPFNQKGTSPLTNSNWIETRDKELNQNGIS